MNLYASVLRLDRADIRTLKVTDIYSLHRVVYSLFDDVRSESQKRASFPSGIQWVDKGGDHIARRILILSDRKPHAVTDLNLESKQIPSGFLTHHYYRFDVTICPTKRDSINHKLLPIKGREAIATWFVERASTTWGFNVDARYLQVDNVNVVSFKAQDQHLITQQQATLQGSLSVIDPLKFQRSFCQGIGRARGFGCGLLQIVPIAEQLLF